ncbi:MAG: NADH-quinone oxidoreductase subunit C [Flammeovirgaceae bacterium]|nr:NADH-quinone oxidoreductase subunit C [Flammeovirgaceae bacterium]|tara:strand:- start:3136 stop:3621 length:486 start_codon:yes stop_codon:yes gene_type:complete
MTTDLIFKLLKSCFGQKVMEINLNDQPRSIEITSQENRELFTFLRDNNQLYFDMLSSITGIDNGPEVNTMELIYNLYSIPFDSHLMVKIKLEDRESPIAPTVSDIWKTANWHEREIFDLLGIRFEGHPDLRRILLPSDWEGHPLRKDDVLQKRYHGIKVDY